MVHNSNQKWVFSEGEIEKHFGPHVVIADVLDFIANSDELSDWLDLNTPGWTLQGVVITFCSKQDQTLFKLVWG